MQGYLAGPGVVGEMIGAKGKPSYMYRDCWDAETNPNGKFPSILFLSPEQQYL